MKNAPLLVAALLILLVASDALAQTEGPPTGFYFEPSLGINWVDQETDHTHPADPGFHMGLVGGWRINRHWALELHTGYLRNIQPATPDYQERTTTQIPLVANFAFHFPNSSRFEPYLGGGIGVDFVNQEGEQGADGALQVNLGVRYRLEERLELGLSYRFLMVAVGSMFAEEPVGNDTLNLSVKIGP